MTQSGHSPTVEEVLSFEDLPLGSLASRPAVVRWSDGTDGEALRWYGDEVLICEGDLIGRAAQVAALPPGPRLVAVIGEAWRIIPVGCVTFKLNGPAPRRRCGSRRTGGAGANMPSAAEASG
jgi:hypothetical protein